MPSLQDFAQDFAPEIRQRGEAYQRERAIRLTKISADTLHAKVTGSEVYRIIIDRERDGSLTYDCTCPYFSDQGPCKHLWGTLVEADERGVLFVDRTAAVTVAAASSSAAEVDEESAAAAEHAAEDGSADDDDALSGGDVPSIYADEPLNGEEDAAHDGDNDPDSRRRIVPIDEDGYEQDDEDPDSDGEDAEPGQRAPSGLDLQRSLRGGLPLDLSDLSPGQMMDAIRQAMGSRNAPTRRPTRPATSNRSAAAPTARGDDAWKQQLKRLSDAMAARPAATPKPLNWPKGRRILYVVELAEIRDGLAISLRTETPGRDGVYERPKLLRITMTQVGQLPEEEDRYLLQMLNGASRSGFGAYYDMPLSEVYDIDDAVAEDVLRRLCQTGRCRLMINDDAALVPLRWDDGPPWEFCLHLKPSPGGRYLVLDGMFRRERPVPTTHAAVLPETASAPAFVDESADGDVTEDDSTDHLPDDEASAIETPDDETSDTDEAGSSSAGATSAVTTAADGSAVLVETRTLTNPDLILPGVQHGLVIIDGTIARLQHYDAFPLIIALCGGEVISVPLDKQADLLKLLLKFPRLPRLQLPADLEITEITAPPRPRLRITSPGKVAGRGPREMLVARVSFDYNGTVIDRNDGQAALLVADGKTLLRRDMQREALYLSELGGLGFREESDYWNKTRITRLPPNKLPRAVAELTRRGWTVEADGKLYRSAGQITVSVSSGIDWFELHGEINFDGLTASLPKLLAALRKGDGVVQLDDGTFGLLPEEWLKKYGGLAGLGEVEGDTLKFSARQVGFLDALLSSLPEARFDEAFGRARDELMRFAGVEALNPPDTFHGELRAYQREGLGWMGFLRKFGFGGVLADDMGLGKTVQVLALLEARRREREADRNPSANGTGTDSVSLIPATKASGPSLVVAPRSLVFNWKAEAEKFAPGLRVLDHTAVDRARSADHFTDYDLVLTTYGTLRRDMSYFKDVRFDYAILDEAQAIKNASSESAKAARLIQADHRLCLSGTPVQNHLGELWSLFDFLNPGMMGSLGVFRELSADAANKDATARELLAKALRPFILRRTKEQVAKDLPEKLEQTIYCELEKDQRKLYDELRDHYRTSLLERVAREGMNKAKIMVLEALLRLRQAACHPGLIDKTRSGEASAKIDALTTHIAEVIDEGHKVLVFSQFTSLLAIVRDRLDKDSIVYEYLDGRTKDRQARVDRFQNDPDCKLFLISLKAGGVGLNLTSAEYVFLLDPWWNPAVEAQAIDRAHRIGQTRRVFAYRLIAKDTVEEKVLQLQQTKKDLADAIINADNSLIRGLSRDDLELLLS
jgi:superfamily II DNA or RNA helicase